MLCKSNEAGSRGHSGVTMCKKTEAVHPSPRHGVPVSHGNMHVKLCLINPGRVIVIKSGQEMEGSFSTWMGDCLSQKGFRLANFITNTEKWKVLPQQAMKAFKLDYICAKLTLMLANKTWLSRKVHNILRIKYVSQTASLYAIINTSYLEMTPLVPPKQNILL